MSGPVPELLARWAEAAAAAPDAPAVFAPGGTLSRRALLERAHGAAAAGGPGDRHRVAPDDVRAWLPWLAGCALGGGVFAIDAGGTRAPPPATPGTPAPAPADRPCLALRTSGSTGAPRILLRDRGAWLRCSAAEEALLGLGPGDRVLALGAPAFSLTPYAAFRALHLGAAVGVLDRVVPGAARRLLARLAPTVVYGTPPLVAQLARLGGGQSLRRVVTGGARPTRAQLAAMRGAWPRARIATFYGTAEASFVALNPEPGPDDPGDAGPLFPGVEAAPDDQGRLRVRTPYAALGTAEPDGSIEPLADADGWLTLADRVAPGDDGRVRVLGRSDARIDVGGALLDPAPLERALEALPWVAEAAVVAVPDARRSARAVAVVVTAATPPADAAARMRRACAAAGPVPARCECLAADAPRTAGGKLDRRALAARLARDGQATEAPG